MEVQPDAPGKLDRFGSALSRKNNKIFGPSGKFQVSDHKKRGEKASPRSLFPLFGQRALARQTADRDFREVDVGVDHMIEVIGEDVRSDIGHDFNDFTINKTRFARGEEVGVSHKALGVDDFYRQRDQSLRARIARLTEQLLAGLFLADAHAADDRRVSRGAVITAVDAGDRQSDRFTLFAVQQALAEIVAQVEQRVQHDGRIAGRAIEVWHHADFALNGGEDVFGRANGRGRVQLGNARHG